MKLGCSEAPKVPLDTRHFAPGGKRPINDSLRKSGVQNEFGWRPFENAGHQNKEAHCKLQKESSKRKCRQSRLVSHLFPQYGLLEELEFILEINRRKRQSPQLLRRLSSRISK
jgi:hypothetical protein